MSGETEQQRAQRLHQQVVDLPTRPVDEHETASRRSFVTGGLAAVAAFGGWRWLIDQQDGPGVPAPLRRGYEFGESLWRNAPGGPGQDAREYALSDVEGPLRFNSRIGLGEDEDYDEDDWEMTIEASDGGEVLDTLRLDDVRALRDQEVDLVVEHKCIEGWSQIVQWGGMPFHDFLEPYRDLDQVDDDWGWIGMATPDGEYYVGMDRATMLHRQTMLTWEVNGELLPPEHGAPVRMTTPLAYGIKQLKRIGRLWFATEPPPDYWAERGYPYLAGL